MRNHVESEPALDFTTYPAKFFNFMTSDRCESYLAIFTRSVRVFNTIVMNTLIADGIITINGDDPFKSLLKTNWRAEGGNVFSPEAGRSQRSVA